MRRPLVIKMTSNGYGASHATMYSMRTVYATRHQAVILALERDGCCHLVSVARRGSLTLLMTVDGIVPSSADASDLGRHHIASVSNTDEKGVIIVGGKNWIKKLTFMLK